MVVYLDDIVVYSKTMEEHIEHLRKVFQVLRENDLFVKKGRGGEFLGAQDQPWRNQDGRQKDQGYPRVGQGCDHSLAW